MPSRSRDDPNTIKENINIKVKARRPIKSIKQTKSPKKEHTARVGTSKAMIWIIRNI